MALRASTTARHGPKASKTSFQAKRRLEALERQQAARRDAALHARQLSLVGLADAGRRASHDLASTTEQHAEASTDVAMAVTPDTPCPPESVKKHYASQLMHPEWLTDIPDGLSQHWYVLPRPEGQRCLVIAAGGKTISRTRSGAMHKIFPSALPGGSSRTSAGSASFSILDCVFCEPEQTFYILDLMCWKGYAVCDCAAEFRLFWAQTKLAESDAGQPASPENPHSFKMLPVYECTPEAGAEGLQAAYAAPVPFMRDGLALVHRETHYCPGPSPLALLWKDAACSRFPIDTDAAGAVPERQMLTLQYLADGAVATSDDPPTVLARLPTAFVQRLGASLRPGRLLRFSMQDGGMQVRDGEPVGADLRYEGAANQRRGRADAISKVLFQHMARTRPITFEDVLAAAAASCREQGAVDMSDVVQRPTQKSNSVDAM